MIIYIYVYPICSGLYKKSLCPFVVSTYFDARQRCCTFRTLPRVLASAESGGTSAQLYNVVHTNYPFDIVWYCLIDYRVYTYTKFIADDDWWRSTIGISGYLFTINYTKEQMHIQYRFSHSLLVLAWVQRVHFRWRVEFAAMWMRSEGRVPEAITEWASHWTTCLKYRLQAFAPLKIFEAWTRETPLGFVMIVNHYITMRSRFSRLCHATGCAWSGVGAAQRDHMTTSFALYWDCWAMW